MRAVYQPVVDLDRDEVVGYEALVPGDPPAAAAGWEGRRAAFAGALDAGLRPPATLFFTVDPATLGTEVPGDMELLDRRARADLKIVAEVSEEQLLADPAGMLDKLEHARDRGWGIALGGVGRDWASLALLALVRPDVVELDHHLIQGALTPEATRVARAVESYARESGAQLLASGVETSDHLARARALGAHLAVGCRFGWPTEMPADASRRRSGTVRIPRPAPIADETPCEVADLTGLRWRTAHEGDLRAIAAGLEQEAAATHTPAVVLSCFESAAAFTPPTAARYEDLAGVAAFVSVFGRAMPAEPAPGVRGVDVPEGHRLGGEWAVIVLSPAFAGALIARPRDEPARPDGRRRFDYTIADDRAVVVRAARALARAIVPLAQPNVPISPL